MLTKDVSTAASAKYRLRKINAGINNPNGINSSPKSIQGKFVLTSAELIKNITSDKMHEINVNPSMIRIDELRAIKNFNFIIKYADQKSPVVQ
jgi:hypothetical protein